MTDPRGNRSWLSAQMGRLAVGRAALLWANSRAQLDELARMGVPKSRLNLLHTPGIDTDFWQIRENERRPGLVVAAGNDPDRDHESLVRAVALARRRTPEIRIELVTRQPLEMPEELGTRTPHLRHVDLRSLYSKAAVVATALRPNLHVSGSTVALEAMACRLPVVMTANPGVDEYVEHGTTGYLVPYGDHQAFADAVVALVNDPDKARAFGEAGRARIEARLSSSKIVAQLAGMLRAV